MRVRVQYTTSVDDDYRRAINAHYGKPGLASRAEVQRWLKEYGSSEDENLMWSLTKERDE